MSVRRTVELRRKRDRREARERAWRESVCGGPLVDVAEPVMGGSTSAEAHGHLIHEMIRRALAVERETDKLLVAFAQGCCVRAHVERQMIFELRVLFARLPGPTLVPTHSTADIRSVPTIPRL